MSPVARSSDPLLGNTPTREVGHVTVEGLPGTDADGGLKVHVQNPSAGGGAGVDPVSIKDGTTATQKLAVDVNGRIGVNNFPATQPVSGTVAVSNLPATQPVSGTVAVSNLPATQAVSLATNTPDVTDRAARLLGHVTVDAAPTTAVTGPLTDAQLRATAVPVSDTRLPAALNADGGVPTHVQNFPASQAVTGTFWQATQPVSGTVAVSNLPATQPVSGTFWQATQPVSLATNTPDVTDRAARLLGHVTVDNASLTVSNGQTQPLTDTQLRAAAVPVTGSGTAGTAATGVVTVQGIAGGVAQPVSISTAPVLQVAPPPVASKKATYAACANFAPAALATDVFTIYGSATKTVVIEKLIIDGIQTTAGSVQFFVIKRSAANTAGTSAAATRVPYDSNDAAATATVLSYTANPTGLGAAVGNIRSDRIFLPGAATAVDAQGRIFMLGDEDMKGVVLRGTAQGMAVNLNGVTVTGGSLNINIEWTEE